MNESPFGRTRDAVKEAGECASVLRDALRALESEFLTPTEAAKLVALTTFVGDTIRQIQAAWEDFEAEWSQNLEFGPLDEASDPASDEVGPGTPFGEARGAREARSAGA
jgi:hypothetical protein